MTRTPRSSSVGASSADAASGSARNTMSASATSRSTSSGTTAPSQMRASAGSGRGALVAPDDIAVGQRDRRMAREHAHQLLAGIAGGAGDGDAGDAAPAWPAERSDGERGCYGHSVVSMRKRIFIQSDA